MNYYPTLVALILAASSQQVIAADTATVKREAEILAGSVLQDVQAAATRDLNTEIPKSGGMTAAGGINFQRTDLPEKGLIHGNMEAEARTKSTDKDFEAGQVARKGFMRAKEFDIRSDAGFLDKAKSVQKNPESTINWLSGQYTDCKQEGGEDIKDELVKTCDEYRQISDKNCHMGQLVEVDARHNYECHQEREIKNKKCERRLKVLCEQKQECNAGGIVPGSVTTGMEWVFDHNNSTLRLGSLGTYYWYCGDNCQKVSSAAKFAIQNKQLIKSFRIKKLFLNNLLQVSINGVTVYNSLGGNQLVITGRGSHAWVDAGLGKGGSCIINAGRKIPDYVDINLVPYLQEGQNEINIELAYSFYGHIHIEIEARQYCCSNWRESWEETCP